MVLESRDQGIAAAVLGGVVLLLFELRFEHREVLGETWQSWIPLAYAGVTSVVGVAALVRWDAGGRRVLAVLFGVGIAVGLLGFWFHTGGHVVTGLRDVLAVWRVPLGRTAVSRWAASRRRWPRWRSADSARWACSSAPNRAPREQRSDCSSKALSAFAETGCNCVGAKPPTAAAPRNRAPR